MPKKSELVNLTKLLKKKKLDFSTTKGRSQLFGVTIYIKIKGSSSYLVSKPGWDPKDESPKRYINISHKGKIMSFHGYDKLKTISKFIYEGWYGDKGEEVTLFVPKDTPLVYKKETMESETPLLTPLDQIMSGETCRVWYLDSDSLDMCQGTFTKNSKGEIVNLDIMKVVKETKFLRDGNSGVQASIRL